MEHKEEKGSVKSPSPSRNLPEENESEKELRESKEATDTKETTDKSPTKEDGEETKEKEKDKDETTKSPLSPSLESSSPKKEKPTPTYRNGSLVLAKVQGKVSKNIWFSAKVISSRQTALGPFEYHVIYTDETVKDTKEWVPERFVTTPLNTDTPPPSTSLSPGVLALGWRKKPGAQAGWWHSVKIIRYLADVPGAFVQWMDFPFPDSILEAGKVFPIVREAPKTTERSPEKEKGADKEKGTEKEPEKEKQGIKRQLSDSEESAPKKEKVA